MSDLRIVDEAPRYSPPVGGELMRPIMAVDPVARETSDGIHVRSGDRYMAAGVPR